MSHSDFNLFDAFALLDTMGRGSLTKAELYNGLVNYLGLRPSQDEIDLFFDRFDRDFDSRLSFAEFSSVFNPKDPGYFDALNSRHSNHQYTSNVRNNPAHVFLPVTLLDFKELLRTVFRIEVEAEFLKQKLRQNPIFKLKDAFSLCDSRKTGKVGVDELRSLIEDRGLFVSDFEATALL